MKLRQDNFLLYGWSTILLPFVNCLALFWYNRHTSTSVRVQQLKSELEAGLDLWRKQVDYDDCYYVYFSINFDYYYKIIILISENEDEDFDNYDGGDDDIVYLMVIAVVMVLTSEEG